MGQTFFGEQFHLPLRASVGLSPSFPHCVPCIRAAAHLVTDYLIVASIAADDGRVKKNYTNGCLLVWNENIYWQAQHDTTVSPLSSQRSKDGLYD